MYRTGHRHEPRVPCHAIAFPLPCRAIADSCRRVPASKPRDQWAAFDCTPPPLSRMPVAVIPEVPAMHLTFSGEYGGDIAIPDAVRDVFLPTMRSDQRRLAAALQLQRLDLIQQMLHRMRGALMIASAQHLADAARLI